MNVVRPLVTACTSDSMFHALTLCTLQIMIMIMIGGITMVVPCAKC